MNRKLKTLIISVCIFGLAVIFGCASVMDVATPCYIPPEAIRFADANVPTFLPYTSLWDAKAVRLKMDFVHTRDMLTGELKYKFLRGLTTANIETSQRFQETIFSPTGPIGLLFPTVFGGTLGALLIKRPGDKSKKEM